MAVALSAVPKCGALGVGATELEVTCHAETAERGSYGCQQRHLQLYDSMYALVTQWRR